MKTVTPNLPPHRPNQPVMISLGRLRVWVLSANLPGSERRSIHPSWVSPHLNPSPQFSTIVEILPPGIFPHRNSTDDIDSLRVGVIGVSMNGDTTATDLNTGLMWDQSGSAEGMDLKAALNWAQEKNAENYLGYSDWRLPDAKELQSIVDYDRSPSATHSAAISALFHSDGGFLYNTAKMRLIVPVCFRYDRAHNRSLLTHTTFS